MAEYEAAVADGSWTPAPRFDIGSFLKNNAACDRLAEFAQIKYAIKRKYGEVEDKRDFDAWLNAERQAPAPTCEQSVIDAFDTAIQGLQTDIAGVQAYSDFMLPDLFTQFGMPHGTFTAFQMHLNDAYEAAKAAGTLPVDTPLDPDRKPATTPECMAQTDPLAMQIDTLAGTLKDLNDRMAFAGEHLCAELAS